MDLIIILGILVFTVLLVLPMLETYQKNKRISYYIDQLPGDRWFPLIGTSWNLMNAKRENIFDLVKTRSTRYGPISRGWMGSWPAVHIYKPEHVQVILKSNTNISKGRNYKFLMPLLGHGLISGSGSKWRRHRKIITPSFHFSVLDIYADIFVKKSEEFVEYLKQFADKGYFSITDHLARLGLDTISETAMGVQFHLLDQKNENALKYAKALNDFFEVFQRRSFNILLANDFFFKFSKYGRMSKESLRVIHEFNSNIIKTKKEYYQKHKNDLLQVDDLGRKKKMSFLDMLLTTQESNHLSDEEIEEEVNTFMFGGQDTTVISLSYALLALGNHLDIQKRIQEEIDTVFSDDPDRKVTGQDLAQMTYFDMVLKEVLRCYSFIPTLGRTLEEDVEIDGHLIPKGVNVLIDMYSLHHDSSSYPDPLKFDPDRFLPENVAKRHPYAFIPFSAGPRNCIGQKFAMRNMKTELTYILRKFNVKCQEKPEDVRVFYEIVLRPQSNLHIALETRH